MDELVKALAAHGAGGVLAALVFWFYRTDRQDSEKKYIELGLNFRSIVEKNTEALTSLRGAIDKQTEVRA